MLRKSALQVKCSVTCVNELSNVAVWQGFPNGAEPLRLEIRWNATGGIAPLAQAHAYFLVEYDIGGGWQIAEEDLWQNSIPSCSPAQPAACGSEHVFVKQLSANMSSGVVKVRATHRTRMDLCPGSCGPQDTPNMVSTMNIRDIQVIAKEPTLEIDPAAAITRGDGVTFWVKGAPEGTTFSNWRYEMATQPTITRTGTVNTSTWTGQLVESGTAKVVATIPHNLLSRTLPRPATVTARNWNSDPKDPTKVTGITPGGIPSPPEPYRWMGYALIDADYLWSGETVPDGPNKGLSYVTWVRHHDAPGTRVEYEISPDVEPGTTFYSKQCGAGGFISGAVLRANGYEHESGTIKGHNQQYRSKLAEPAVNFATWAEPRIGSVWGGYGAFLSFISSQLNDRRTQINNAASVEACNSDWIHDVNCNPSGLINYPPYQPPCQ